MGHTRRDFIKTLSVAAAAGFILPSFVSCTCSTRSSDPLALPNSQPADWDAVTFNMQRALAGAAPESYHDSISSADGDKKHVGKHTPFAPQIADVPDGYIAIMFGDSSKSHPQHPNSGKHWYDWISIRTSTEDNAQEIISNYSAWPQIKAGDNGQYTGDTSAKGGRETVYLAKLPTDYVTGDILRVVGHCTKHGDWVNFV